MKLMTQEQLDAWINDTAWDKPYWNDVHTFAEALDSDGCSGVPDTFAWACLEHDCFYRRHKHIGGEDISKSQADYVLRRRVQQTQMSLLKWPISWIRWFGVAILFRRASQRAWDSFGGTTMRK